MRLVRDLGGPQVPSSSRPKTLQIAMDIANWLPEIAADSDMPEGPWNKVNASPRRLSLITKRCSPPRSANDARELASSFKAISGARARARRRRSSLVWRDQETASGTLIEILANCTGDRAGVL